ncbi:hypothetical protein NicSoilC12_15280 [Arthrobacter sp. NicSoilC12]|nr:hypothetical protein NicSoilC12_15280 [Arthrobacter sp. NicSoilC12]
MRGRQQVYLTIGCAPNWPGLALNPRRGMPIIRGRGGPQVGRAVGHVQSREWAVWGMPIFGGKEWAIWGYVQPSGGLWGSVGAFPFLVGRSGLFGAMSSPQMGRRACPAEEPQAGAGRLNWAKPESSGILVSAFDSEATGEFA